MGSTPVVAQTQFAIEDEVSPQRGERRRQVR